MNTSPYLFSLTSSFLIGKMLGFVCMKRHTNSMESRGVSFYCGGKIGHGFPYDPSKTGRCNKKALKNGKYSSSTPYSPVGPVSIAFLCCKVPNGRIWGIGQTFTFTNSNIYKIMECLFYDKPG